MLFYFCLTCVNSLTEIMSYDWFINLPIQIQRRTSCLLIFFSSTTAHKNKTNTNTLSSVCNYFLLRPNVERHYDNVSMLLLSFEYFDVFYFFRRKKKERDRERKKQNDDGGGYGYINDDTSSTLSNTCIFPPFSFPFLLTTYRPHPCFLKSFIFVVASVRPKNFKPPRAVISPPLLSSI